MPDIVELSGEDMARRRESNRFGLRIPGVSNLLGNAFQNYGRELFGIQAKKCCAKPIKDTP